MEMKGWKTAAFLQKRNVWLMVVQCRPASPLLQLGQRGTSWGRLATRLVRHSRGPSGSHLHPY